MSKIPFLVLKRVAFTFFGVVLALSLLAGCGDDDDFLDNYRFDLCELVTDSQGRLTELRFDDGRHLTPTKGYNSLAPDSVYRVLAVYVPTSDGKAEIAQLGAVISPRPLVFERQPVVTDPVRVLTAWRSPRYFNLRVAIGRSTLQKHIFGFAEEGIEKLDNGTRRLRLRLYHDRNGDAAHYDEETYLSCPTYPYADRLTRGVDSVVMVVHTPEGEQRFSALF